VTEECPYTLLWAPRFPKIAPSHGGSEPPSSTSFLGQSSLWPPNRHGPKLGGGGCALFTGVSGSPSNTKSPGPRPTSIPSGILVHPAVWPQRTLAENWGCAPLGGRELSPRLTQCRIGQGLSPYQVASSSMQPFGNNRRGPKIWGSAPLWEAGWVPI